MFWVLIILSLVCADKLDRTYIPPPGAEYSAGRPEDIQIPLEYPRLEYPRLEYPNGNDYMGHMEIAIGIDRVGPKQVSDAQKEYENTLPAMNNIITQTKPNNSIGFDYTANYSYNGSPNIQNTHKEQDQIQNNYRFPANLIIDNNNYPSQFQTGNIFADTKSSLPTTIQPQSVGDEDSVIYVPCNRSLPIDFINNTCTNNNNANQYFSTLSPTTNYISTTSEPSSITSKYSDYSNPSKLPSYVNTAFSTFYSPTTKSPYNGNSFNFDVIAKRPERVQAQADREAVILNYENLLTPEPGYAYSFDTSNGIHGDESGIAVNGVRAKGSYSYIGDDGKRYSVVYTADENGFRPQGDHLPTPPPIPDAILKVIEKAFEDKKAGIFDDGSYDENKYGYKKYQKNPYELSFLNYKRGQEKKIDRLNSRNNIPLEPIQEKSELESLTKISESNYSKNISELKQDNNQEVVQDDINYTNVKEMKDIPEQIEFYKKIPIQGKNTTYDITNLSPITKLPSFTEMDRQYFSKQNEEANEFPTRFSEMQSIRNENKQEMNVTPKPFMTPYVSRISKEDDEIEISDSKEKNYKKPEQYLNDDSQQNYNNAEYSGGNGLRNQSDFPDISDNNDSFKLTNNGYFYPKVTNSEETLFSQHANPYLPISSNGPLEFSSQSTIPNFDQYYSVAPQSTSTPSSLAIKEKGSENLSPTSFPNYSTTKLDFVNEYGNTNTPTVSNFNDAYGTNKENMIDSSKSVSTSRPDIPQFKASYSPNIDLMISNYNTIPSTTDKNIVEIFSGPKRPQSFDPLTGYHY